jgi:hypothetical protein
MSDEAHNGRFEPGGVDTWKVLILAFGILALLIVSVGGLYVAFVDWTPPNRTPAIKQFPRPRQEADPAQELRILIAKQRKELSTYHWIDSSHERVSIPIERAMQITAQRGEKAFDPIQANQRAPSSGSEIQSPNSPSVTEPRKQASSIESPPSGPPPSGGRP